MCIGSEEFGRDVHPAYSEKEDAWKSELQSERDKASELLASNSLFQVMKLF
jgi:hypothetical protein